MTAEQLQHRKEWVAALRGGKYKQGQSALRRTDGTFCCLGVACDLHAKAFDAETNWRRLMGACDYMCYLGSEIHLDGEVQDWLGLEDCSPTVTIDGQIAYLTKLNDCGTPFNEIANLIEKEYIEGVAVYA